jgi:hypothetical protein
MSNVGQVGMPIGFEVPNDSKRNRPKYPILTKNFGTDLDLRFQSLPERLLG